MELRDELERLDSAVLSGRSYGIKQDLFRKMLDTLKAVDDLGIAIAEAGYEWTPAMREAYERATRHVALTLYEREKK